MHRNNYRQNSISKFNFKNIFSKRSVSEPNIRIPQSLPKLISNIDMSDIEVMSTTKLIELKKRHNSAIKMTILDQTQPFTCDKHQSQKNSRCSLYSNNSDDSNDNCIAMKVYRSMYIDNSSNQNSIQSNQTEIDDIITLYNN